MYPLLELRRQLRQIVLKFLTLLFDDLFLIHFPLQLISNTFLFCFKLLILPCHIVHKSLDHFYLLLFLLDLTLRFFNFLLSRVTLALNLDLHEAEIGRFLLNLGFNLLLTLLLFFQLLHIRRFFLLE